LNWNDVAKRIEQVVLLEEIQESYGNSRLNAGQRASLQLFGKRLPHNGVVLADEVGMGKTRIAVAVIEAVVHCGGRVAILIPSGLGYQWHRELVAGSVIADPVLRGIVAYMDAWAEPSLLPYHRRHVVTLSHAFSNWTIRKQADERRWILLPAVVATLRNVLGHSAASRQLAAVRKLDGGADALVAAAAIVTRYVSCTKKDTSGLLDFAETAKWAPLLRAAEYGAQTVNRRMLMKVVGLGLGRFDLVIVDEAHKSRGKDARLSVLLDDMLIAKPKARFIAMSATPVEVDAAQWLQTLGRIRFDQVRLPAIKGAIEGYTKALEQVRRSWRTSVQAREDYLNAAREFQRELGDFVLRRDKREDMDVQLFHKHGGLHYRDTGSEILIDTHTLDMPWKRAICAAEALSVIYRPGDMSDKLLRLTLASGHGTAKFLDQNDGDEDLIEKQLAEERASGAKVDEAAPSELTSDAKARAKWWRNVLLAALRSVKDPIFAHPAIAAAVAAIERRTGAGEKVLVFGRYTRPMQTLEQLLNAREMLRRLAQGRYWPQSILRDGAGTSQWPAVRAAYMQWENENGIPHPVALEGINAFLAKQSRDERNLRERFRNRLVSELKTHVASLPIYGLLWEGLQVASQRHQLGQDDTHPVAILARALLETTANKAADMDAAELGREFIALADAVLDNDPFAQDEKIKVGADKGWSLFEKRLNEEYATRTGIFARCMNGQTELSTRRIIQQSFNRLGAGPMVLIAQSLVGREGLNLHEACRVVILLHPEWNPAVVEQQIGRVDRVGSHWAREVQHAIDAGHHGNDLPRIEVIPVIFRGTYDDHNWQVLRERWDDLRAQLHGEVIPPRSIDADCSDEEKTFLHELAAAAPDFSPTAPWRNG
jgi:superfamily II DNA or RNA helicase